MNEIEMTRGDSLKLKFQRKLKDESVIKELVDEIYMTCKSDFYSKEFVFQKKLSDDSIKFDEGTGYYHIVIEPKDTEELRYGNYVFDIEITKDDVVKTIFKGILKITEEVTCRSDKEKL